MSTPLIVGNVSERPRPKVNIYYNALSGDIVGVGSSRAPMEEFSEYEVKEVSWDEGSPFLNGEKDIGTYFINIDSVRKELVKRNLVQIYGHEHNFDYFDLAENGALIDDIDEADVVIIYQFANNQWKTNVYFTTYIKYDIYITELKRPLNVYEKIPAEKYRNLIFNGKRSLYTHMDNYRRSKVFCSTEIILDKLETSHVHE